VSFEIQLATVLILALLAATAIAVVRMRDLWAAAMLMGIYSFLGASWMMLLDAPDVAFTEASVGAGISTILVLAALALTTTRAKEPVHSPLLGLLVVCVTGGALLYGTLDMPHFGDGASPANSYPQPSYVERTEKEIEVPNVVTAVLGSYRGYDTLGETSVIFTAGISVLLLLRGTRSRRDEPEESREEERT